MARRQTQVPVLIAPQRFADSRGWFSETYSERRFAQLGIACRFVQDNHSLSREAGTLRGLHVQIPPHAQAKLVRVVQGAILDVAVDVRRGSPTYGRHVAAELSAENGLQLFVPIGFARGFVTLTPDAQVLYKVSNVYAPECDRGIVWNDPALSIPWPLGGAGPVLSDKDAALPLLADFDSPFGYDGVPLGPLETAGGWPA